MTADYAIVLAGHGSRDPDGVREFEQLVALMRERVGGHRLDYGYLEFARPTLAEAVQASIAAGSRRIVVVPALLFAATHAKNDMPGELHMLQQAFPDVALHFGAALDLHPLLLRLAQQRIVEAEAQATHYIRRADTCLVVVGRGTSDPDANSEIAKLCRMLEEGMGFGASFVCYSGTAKPLVADGLRAAARLGQQRLIVLPFLLFDGILVKRVYDAAAALAARHPEIEVLTTHYMGVHPDIADLFLERAHEGVEGRAHMNCSLCKYRVQIVGFERQVGEPQRPHHRPVTSVPLERPRQSYVAPPLEAENFRVIEAARDWSRFCGRGETRRPASGQNLGRHGACRRSVRVAWGGRSWHTRSAPVSASRDGCHPGGKRYPTQPPAGRSGLDLVRDAGTRNRPARARRWPHAGCGRHTPGV